MSNDNQLATRIESKIDKTATGNLAIGAGGNLDFANLNEIMEVAKVVAIAEAAIPKHLRNNVGACLAICIQASEWKLSPFAVANKTYVVNDRIAFEAQLIAAVILRRAPILGRIKYEFTGSGPKRQCTASAVLQEDGSTVEYTSPEFAQIPVKNSPLWKNDPDQQLGYFSVRAMCRRHFPDVILGIYTPEELAESVDIEATVTKLPQGRVGAATVEKPKTITELAQKERKSASAPPIRDDQTSEPLIPERETEGTPATAQADAQSDAGEREAQRETDRKREAMAPTAKELLDDLLARGGKIDAGASRIEKAAAGLRYIEPADKLKNLSAEKLAELLDAWAEIADAIQNPGA